MAKGNHIYSATLGNDFKIVAPIYKKYRFWENIRNSLYVFFLILGVGITNSYAGIDEDFPKNAYQSKSYMTHVVQPGETLSEIADMYDYNTSDLAEFNNISDKLLVGQEIKLPMQNDGDMKNDTYESANSNETKNWSVIPYNPTESTNSKVDSAQDSDNQLFDSKKKNENDIFGGKSYAYYGIKEPLSKVLEYFAGNYGIPVIVSDRVKGEINGRVGPFSPVDFLNELSKLYNLIWYFDGNTLYIYHSSEIEKKIINLKHLKTYDFRRILIEMGMWDNRFYWRSRPDEGLIYLSGPPRYMELVTQTAALLDIKAGERLEQQVTVKVFPLKYAWADDRSFSYRDQQIVIPGVATTLSQIVQGGKNINMAGNTKLPTPQVLGAQSVDNSKAPKNADNGTQTGPLKPSVKDVFINADRRLNAVIIRDLESKMPMYASLINTLDKPLSQVEVNVSIIDIDTNSLERLGVEWKLSSSSNNKFIEFNPFGAANATDSFSTIVNTASSNLFAQINVLSSNGKAKVLARPSVLTLNNMEAVLDNSQTFYVEVAGTDDAQLFPVTYGSVLKVTPRIVKEVTGRKIHLSVNIHDGTRAAESENVKDLPTIKNSSISTQAVIDERESLLVGGYYYEKTVEGTSKVPILGDLPILGAMFRDKRDEYTKTVRLFLITPRIINLM